jgi:uncharacterized phage protein gp47/JayE
LIATKEKAKNFSIDTNNAVTNSLFTCQINANLLKSRLTNSICKTKSAKNYFFSGQENKELFL